METRELISESINRMFSELVSRSMLEKAEQGEWQEVLWKQVQDAGFQRSLAAEDQGGGGLAWTDAYPIFHAVGYWRAPVPLVETLIGAYLLSKAGLPCDTDGPITVIQVGGSEELQACQASQYMQFSGTVRAVPWARRAAKLVLSGMLDGRAYIALVEHDGRNISLREGSNIAAEPRDQLSFNATEASACRFFDDPGMAEAVKVHAALGRAIAMVGAAESALDQSVRYAQERQQFGRPIAKFQAVQHMLAIMACEVSSAAAATEAACDAMLKSDPRFAVAVAKVRSGEAAGVVAKHSHQVHGAFGMTYEHTLHFATKRLWAWRAENGNDTAWARELGSNAIGAGGANFWPGLTARTAP